MTTLAFSLIITTGQHHRLCNQNLKLLIHMLYLFAILNHKEDKFKRRYQKSVYNSSQMLYKLHIVVEK